MAFPATSPAANGGGGGGVTAELAPQSPTGYSPMHTNTDGDADSVRRRGGPQRDWYRRTLVVMHFNVLAQIYESDHLPDHAGLFHRRSETIAQQIEYHSPDCVSLNECNPITWYRDKFGSWYDIYYASKADGMRRLDTDDMAHNVNDLDDGTAIMLKRGVVSAVQVHRITAMEPHCLAGGGNPNDPLSPSPNMARQFALLAHCYHHHTGNHFYFCSMHMKANPMGSLSDCPRRVAHLLQILRTIDQIRAEAMPAPLIFVGDFNSPPGTPTIDLLMRGRATVLDRTYESPTKNVRFESAMSGSCNGGDPEFTILSSQYESAGWSSVLDYILYEKGKFLVTGQVTMPTLAAFGADAVPHSGSDHIPLIAELAFLQQQHQQQHGNNGLFRGR